MAAFPKEPYKSTWLLLQAQLDNIGACLPDYYFPDCSGYVDTFVLLVHAATLHEHRTAKCEPYS